MKTFVLSLKQYGGSIWMMALALVAPLLHVMAATCFLLLADFVTGMWAARTKGEAITSRKMKRTVSKLFLYNLLIITSMLVENYLMGAIPFVKLATGLIAMTEIKSMYENVNVITGMDVWKAVADFVTSKRQIASDAMVGSEEESKPKDIFDIGK